MKAVLGILGAFVLAVCIFPTDASGVETKLPLNFLDFPVELRLGIFEHLDLIDLIRVSKTHPVNRNSIGEMFRKILRNHEVEVYFHQFTDFVKLRLDNIYVDISYGNASESFEEMLEFFQYFGHFVTKLRYSYDSSVHYLCEQVHQQIAKYVAESLIELVINFRNRPINGSMADLFVPYPNCKVVKLCDNAIDAETLHQMFPVVQSLDLTLMKVNESLSHFPYLERFGMPQNWFFKKPDFPLLEKTLELNPQIKHLSIFNNLNLDVFQMLNKTRPDLEGLGIDYFKFNEREHVDVPFRFTHMKVFKCLSTDANRIPFEFGNLEEIEFGQGDGQGDLADHWADIMMQNKKLRKVTATGAFQRDHLMRIAEGLPNLEEFKMIYYRGNPKSMQDNIDFLQNANQLKKVIFAGLDTNECEEWAQQLKKHWKNVENKNYASCSFIRK